MHKPLVFIDKDIYLLLIYRNNSTITL